MPRRRKKSWANFRFRFRSKPEDTRKDDPVRSVAPSLKEVSRRRWQTAFIAAKCAGITVLVGVFLSFAARVWRESISANPGFSVGEFGFESNVPAERGGLTRQTILDVTGLRPDANVMKVDLHEIHESLTALPQIREASVQRYFPNRIDIRVEERRPVAWLDCPAKDIIPRDSIKGRLLDETGCVFPCRSLLTNYAHLPELALPALAWAEDGKPLSDRRALRALDILTACNGQIWPRPLTVRRLEVLGAYSIRATFSDAAEVVFGLENIDRQARRLVAIYEWAEAHGKSVETAALIAERNVPVTFFPQQAPRGVILTGIQPDSEPPPSPEPPAPRAVRPVSGAPRGRLQAASQEDRDIEAILRGN